MRMMGLLVKAGAEVNKTDGIGRTALMYAAEYGDRHGEEMISARRRGSGFGQAGGYYTSKWRDTPH